MRKSVNAEDRYYTSAKEYNTSGHALGTKILVDARSQTERLRPRGLPKDEFFEKVRIHCEDSTKAHLELKNVCSEWLRSRKGDSNAGFVNRSADLLNKHPQLFNELCSMKTFRHWFTASCSTLDGAIDLVVLREHDRNDPRWDIYPISPSAMVDPDFGSVRRLRQSELDSILHTKAIDRTHFLMSTNRWIKATIEILACEAYNGEHLMGQADLCSRALRTIVTHTGILPTTFYIRDVVREGKNAVTGGGFSDIWKGKIYGDPVCLKVLRIFLSGTSRNEVIKDFCREALVWKNLNHKNVLPFLGVNVDLFSPSFCIVLPWMENGSIVSYLEANNPKITQRERALSEIAQGLNYLHKRSPPIVHGDIRGANVLVNDSGRCCIADFGLAAISETHTLTITSHGIRGSTRWMAPELLDSKRRQLKSYPSRDVYAFGCTALEVMTGKPPFFDVKHDIMVTLDVIQGIRPPRPSADIISDDLWSLIQSCWDDNPEVRPTMGEVLSILGHDVDDENTENAVAVDPESLRRFSWPVADDSVTTVGSITVPNLGSPSLKVANTDRKVIVPLVPHKKLIPSSRASSTVNFKWIKGELIEKGTYGSVHFAINVSTGEMLAVKQIVIPQKDGRSPKDYRHNTIITALGRMVEILVSFNHRNLVRYFGLEETPAELSILMEYVSEGSVRSLLQKHGKFNGLVTKYFASQVLSGLEYLHSQGMAHRSLSSSDVLVEDGTCKLCNFGISQFLSALAGSPTAESRTDTTVDFFKADIWSLGCMITEMWTGKRQSSSSKDSESTPPPLPDVTEMARNFMALCFTRNPDERPSAGELLRHDYLNLPSEWRFTGFDYLES